MAQKNFPFIVLSGPKVDDPSARRVIRKQAMKGVGEARKRRGNHGQINRRQLPRYEHSNIPMRGAVSSSSDDDSRESSMTLGSTPSESSDSSHDTEPTDYDEEVDRTDAFGSTKALPVALLHDSSPLSFGAINLFSNYETARAKFMVDLTDLSVLTNFHIGKSTISLLSADPTRLASLLGQQQWSYLQYVPSLYGSSEVVTAAANCVMAKTKTTLSPRESCKEVTLRLYTKALRCLQTAISDESGCTGADVLCATQLLSLHELLDPSRDTAWSQHIKGSARLVRHRTAERFKTEFDKALFAAHVGPTVSECLMGNMHCYLEEDEWSDLYKSLIQDSVYLHDRSSLTINVRLIEIKLPGLWYEVQEAINSPKLFDDKALAALEAECRKSHRAYIDWMEDYKAHCVRLSLANPTPKELSMRRELFGAALECLSLVKRFLATVCDRERVSLEPETQALATLLLDLQNQPSPKHSWLFTGHEVGVAYTMRLTKDQWEGDFTYESDYERRMAIRTRYNTWSNTLRMID